MPLRKMKVDDGVLKFHVPEQELNGPQIGSGLKQMRSEAVP
jgi:hypothetical protein